MSKLINLKNQSTNHSVTKPKLVINNKKKTSKNYIPIDTFTIETFYSAYYTVKMKTPYHNNKRKDREYLKNIELLDSLYNKHKSGELICFDLALPMAEIAKIKKTMSTLLDLNPVSERKTQLNDIVKNVITQSLQHSCCNLLLSNIPEVGVTPEGIRVPIDEAYIHSILSDAGIVYRVSKLGEHYYMAWLDENSIAEAVATRLDGKGYINGQVIGARYIFSAPLHSKYSWRPKLIEIPNELPIAYNSEFPQLTKSK